MSKPKTKRFRFRPNRNIDGPGSMGITNGKRAKWAENAVKTFIGYPPCDDHSDPIADLIADLLHLCDRDGIDPFEALERGESMWEEER